MDSILTSYRGKPKNKVKLPSESSITSLFKCVLCNKIPSVASTKTVVDSVAPGYGHVLCEDGHVICVDCAIMVGVCPNAMAPGATSKDGVIWSEDLHYSSLSDFGMRPICAKPITEQPCRFLEEMIDNSETDCENYLAWCEFRGTPVELSLHQPTCEYGNAQKAKDLDPTKDETTSTSNNKVDDDRELALLALELNML